MLYKSVVALCNTAPKLWWSVLSHSFYLCLQMHDIVKAVGNCSYNQLVEKIISCKQSDNSELAGEGECFLFTASPFRSAWLPSCLPSLLFQPIRVEKKSSRSLRCKLFNLRNTSGKFTSCLQVQTCSYQNHRLSANKTRTAHQMTYFLGSHVSYQLSVTSQLNICSFNT